MNKKNKIMIVICSIIIFVGLGLLIFNNFKSKEPIKEKYEDYVIYDDVVGKLEDYDSSMTVEGAIPGEKAYYITGRISSKHNKNFSVITYNLYDKKGKLLGEAVAGLNTLKKDDIYSFKAMALIEQDKLVNIDNFKLKDVKLGNGE